jgi:myo-inositol-1(or 4)-monophosphatase
MAKPAPQSHAALLETAHHLADSAAAAILPFFRKPVSTRNKAQAGYDPVTAADLAAERVIRTILQRDCPGHGIVGEELGETFGDARYTWVIDPIDGTRAFLTGYPLWGVLIGVKDGDDAVVGIMEQPFTGERFWASPKGAFTRRGNTKPMRLSTRACTSLDSAVLASTTPEMFKTRQEKAAFARVSDAVRMTRFGGDCYAYAMLAAGNVDLVVEASLKPVDIVALIPIIERAGGCITTWDGKSAVNGGRIVAAGDPRLHAAALEVLAG